jgi:hypothetical protein
MIEISTLRLYTCHDSQSPPFGYVTRKANTSRSLQVLSFAADRATGLPSDADLASHTMAPYALLNTLVPPSGVSHSVFLPFAPSCHYPLPARPSSFGFSSPPGRVVTNLVVARGRRLRVFEVREEESELEYDAVERARREGDVVKTEAGDAEGGGFDMGGGNQQVIACSIPPRWHDDDQISMKLESLLTPLTAPCERSASSSVLERDSRSSQIPPPSSCPLTHPPRQHHRSRRRPDSLFDR